MKRFLAFLVAIALVSLPAFAETTGQLGGMDSDGAYYWTVDDDGTLIGGTGAEISLGGQEKSSWGDIVSPMTDEDGYTTTTDAGSKLKLHDDGDLTLGGAVATDVVIIFDSDSNDYYAGVNDSENEFQIGYGSAIGTTEQISIQSSGVIMIGENDDVDSGFVFQAGAQDVYMGIDYTGGEEEDLFCIGLGATIGTTPELSIGKSSGMVYVNAITSPGSADLDIGEAGVTDVTVTTDGGAIILDGTITLPNGEVITGDTGTDDTIRVQSNDLDTIFEIYTPYDTTGDATLKLSSDLGDAAGEQWTITSTGATTDLVIGCDDTTPGTPITKFTIADSGIVTSTNYIESKKTDTSTNAVVDVMKLTHDGGTAAAGVGTGLVFQVDDTGGIEEQASIDVSLSTVTNGAEDADFIINLNQAGTMREVLKIDSDLGDAGTNVLEYTGWTTEANGVVDLVELTLDTTGDTSTDGFGAGISILLEDEPDAAEQQASIDFVLTDAGSTAEDCDIVFSQNIAGAIEERVRFDADDDTILLTGTTPKMTIGDGGDEDAILTFDGQTNDFYVGFDTTDDLLNIGVGEEPGTTCAIEINASANVLVTSGMTIPYQIHATADTLTINEGSKLHVFGNASEYALTLPAVSTAAGIHYHIVVGLSPSGTSYTVITNASENKITGTTVVNGEVIGASEEDTITFTLDAAVIGDYIDLYCDGVLWYVSGQAFAATGIVFTGT